MCQRNECRTKSERTVCVPKKPVSMPSNGTYSTLAKPEADTYPESPIRETSINISQQILPVHQLKVSIPSRDRSRSETELNMFNPKLIIVRIDFVVMPFFLFYFAFVSHLHLGFIIKLLILF